MQKPARNIIAKNVKHLIKVSNKQTLWNYDCELTHYLQVAIATLLQIWSKNTDCKLIREIVSMKRYDMMR